MREEKLSYKETTRRFDVSSHTRIMDWERIYLEEGPESGAIERYGRGSKGRPPKQLPKDTEEGSCIKYQGPLWECRRCLCSAADVS